MWRRRSRSESDSTRCARAAAERAAAQHRRVDAQWPAVEKIAGQVDTALKGNHFGESIELAMRRKAT